MADTAMNRTVKDVLTDVFLRRNEKHDVHALAAERLAINLLNDAWRELDVYAMKEADNQRPTSNPGL